MSESMTPDPSAARIGTIDLPVGSPAALITLLQTAAGPAEPGELREGAAAVAAFLAQSDPVHEPRGRPSVRTVRVAAAAAVVSAVLGGGLAAADVLPAPAQRWVSHALGAVGIDVPSPDRPGGAEASSSSSQPPSVPIDIVGGVGVKAGVDAPGPSAVPTLPAAIAPPVGAQNEAGSGTGSGQSASSGLNSSSGPTGGGSGGQAGASSSSGNHTSSGKGQTNRNPDTTGKGTATANGRAAENKPAAPPSGSKSPAVKSGAALRNGGVTPGSARPSSRNTPQ